ncbi:MAG TPA: FtsX-like permease family protein [Salinimicrobium sp.]|nr:FtsX-like permease family protein [Salinimicrobium sp.]
MNFSFYIAKRYLFAKSSSNVINIITIVAAIGVFAGAFSLFIVLSGFAGLKNFSLSFSNDFDPDLKVFPEKGKTFDFSEMEKEKLSNIKGVVHYSEVIEERVFLDFKSKNKMAFIKGVDEHFLKVNQVDSALVRGSWLIEDSPNVVIGNSISMDLSLGVYDYSNLLKIFVPKPGKGQIMDPTGAFNSKNAIVTGIYSINEELDSKYVFSTIDFARDLLDLEQNLVSALEIRVAEDYDPDVLKDEIAAVFDSDVNVKNRAQLNESLYRMLNTENLAVYLIFTLVLIIALFNVVGSIIMVILDKKENIKTYFSLGATPGEIRNIFFFQGTFLSVFGGIIGLVAGLILVFLQLEYNLVMITPTLPYPVAITVQNVIVVFLTISSLGIGASYLASSRIAKVLQH